LVDETEKQVKELAMVSHYNIIIRTGRRWYGQLVEDGMDYQDIEIMSGIGVELLDENSK
jgi:hypothetical protein